MLTLKRNKPSEKQTLPATAISRMKELVNELSFPRVFGTKANEKARDYLFQRFVQLTGEQPKILGDTKNIVFGDPETAKFIVGAHYDSVPRTPGADDNASAVAVMFEVLHNLGNKDCCFVSFNGEECGLLGATEFVKSLPKKNRIKQVHVLEMVGYRSFEPNSQQNPVAGIINDVPTVGDFIGAVSLTPKLVSNVMAHADLSDIPVVGLSIPPLMGVSLMTIKKLAPHLLRSDHAPFWDAGLPAIMWTDTAEFRNHNYHQVTDTPETLDYEFMSSVSGLLKETILEEDG